MGITLEIEVKAFSFNQSNFIDMLGDSLNRGCLHADNILMEAIECGRDNDLGLWLAC